MDNQLHPFSGEKFSSKKFRYSSPKIKMSNFWMGGGGVVCVFWTFICLFFLKCPVYKNTHEIVSSWGWKHRLLSEQNKSDVRYIWRPSLVLSIKASLVQGQHPPSAEVLFSSSGKSPQQPNASWHCFPGRAVFHVRPHTEQIAELTHLLSRTELSPFVSMEEQHWPQDKTYLGKNLLAL